MMTTSLGRFLRRFSREEQGNVLLLFALAVIFLVGIGGAAIDLGRQQIMSVKLQQAADASATSVASLTNQGTALTTAQQLGAGRRYFYLNTYIPGSVTPQPQGNVSVSNGGKSIIITAGCNSGNNGACGDAATVTKSNFVSHFGVNNLNSYGSSEVAANAAVNGTKYDMIMSIDISGSMQWNVNSYWMTGNTNPPSRMSALRTAATTLNNSLLGNGNPNNNRIGVEKWDQSDEGHIDLTSSQSSVQNFINGLSPAGSTNSSSGLARVLSMASTYRNDGSTAKVVVLLTDGYNDPGMDAVNAASVAVCNALKAQGVLIYTIAYGQDIIQDPNSGKIKKFLGDCATGSYPSNGPGASTGQYFYIAPDQATLDTTFQNITTSVKSVRIVH